MNVFISQWQKVGLIVCNQYSLVKLFFSCCIVCISMFFVVFFLLPCFLVNKDYHYIPTNEFLLCWKRQRWHWNHSKPVRRVAAAVCYSCCETSFCGWEQSTLTERLVPVISRDELLTRRPASLGRDQLQWRTRRVQCAGVVSCRPVTQNLSADNDWCF